MHEEEVVQETPVSCSSPLHSPCASPTTGPFINFTFHHFQTRSIAGNKKIFSLFLSDTITPLKKRRLMRESMSSDMPTPTSPCVTNSPSVLSERPAEYFGTKPDKIAEVDDKAGGDSVETSDNCATKQAAFNADCTSEPELREDDLKVQETIDPVQTVDGGEKSETVSEPMELDEHVDISADEPSDIGQNKECATISHAGELEDCNDEILKSDDAKSHLHEDEGKEEVVVKAEPLNIKTEVAEDDAELAKCYPGDQSAVLDQQDKKPTDEDEVGNFVLCCCYGN